MAKTKKAKKKSFSVCTNKMCENQVLEFLPKFVHESVETNEEVVHDAWRCNECKTLYYFENGCQVKELVFFVGEKYTHIGQKSDYDIAIQKKREQELVAN